MTGIIKTDQIQGAQGSSVTVTTGHSLITDSATIATLNATTMKGVTTFSDSAVFSGHLSTSQIPNLNGFRYSASSVTTVSSAVSSIDFSVPAGTTSVKMVYQNLSAASSGEMGFRLSTGGSFLTSGYLAGSMYVSSSSNQGATNYTGQFPMIYGYNATDNAFNGIARFSCTTLNHWSFNNTANSGGYPSGTGHAAGKIDLGSNNTLDAVRVYALSGNVDAGIVKCYFS